MNIKSALCSRTWFIARYGSICLIALIYFPGRSGTRLLIELAVALLLALTATITVRMYERSRHNPGGVRLIAAGETAAIVLLLLPTGGPGSPFRWYALNPLMAASELLHPLFAWCLLAGYIGVLSLLFYTFVHFSSGFGSMLTAENTAFVAVLAVIVVAVQMTGQMVRELEKANARSNETLEHIKSIYHIVETASHHEFMNIGQVIADCVVKLTKLNKAFFWFVQRPGETLPASGQNGWLPEEARQLFGLMEEHLEEWRRNDEAFYRSLEGYGDFLLMPVRMNTRFAGVIGVRLETPNTSEGGRWLTRQLILLQELSSIILERHELAVTENRLVIINEQNRIADEMHDSVSQSLFGIVYAAHSLKQIWRELPGDRLEEQIDLIKDSATLAAKELRKTIHSLSSKKSSGQSWLGTVRSHLGTLSRLNNVEIELTASGDDYGLPYHYQKALFRIISEAAGNAIRHGKARLIRVDISLRSELIKLSIADNGCGFEAVPSAEEETDGGLGMQNMRYLTRSLGGEIMIRSRIGTGTQIELSIPVGALEYH